MAIKPTLLFWNVPDFLRDPILVQPGFDFGFLQENCSDPDPWFLDESVRIRSLDILLY